SRLIKLLFPSSLSMLIVSVFVSSILPILVANISLTLFSSQKTTSQLLNSLLYTSTAFSNFVSSVISSSTSTVKVSCGLYENSSLNSAQPDKLKTTDLISKPSQIYSLFVIPLSHAYSISCGKFNSFFCLIFIIILLCLLKYRLAY